MFLPRALQPSPRARTKIRATMDKILIEHRELFDRLADA
ncbi:hypothetical protein APY03_4991 [Variovorax sp. WDL1]|nr:hypothetical protein APY03_4991 [Variovorax sp. WDL1]